VVVRLDVARPHHFLVHRRRWAVRTARESKKASKRESAHQREREREGERER
jgi:hypothetical protein